MHLVQRYVEVAHRGGKIGDGFEVLGAQQSADESKAAEVVVDRLEFYQDQEFAVGRVRVIILLILFNPTTKLIILTRITAIE